MLRFIVLIWDSKLDHALVAPEFAALTHSPEWRIAFKGSGILALNSAEHSGSGRVYELAEGRGIVFGTIFSRGSCTLPSRHVECVQLDSLESARISETKGQHLIDKYWGRYVAFLNDPVHREQIVLRDPTGYFPCFRREHNGVSVYFSRVVD